MTSDLSHFDAEGRSRMFDVGDKPISRRMPRASGFVVMQPTTLARIRDAGIAKGSVLKVARLAAMSTAALTIYDLCKSIDRAMAIDPLQLEDKLGGRSGDCRRDAKKNAADIKEE